MDNSSRSPSINLISSSSPASPLSTYPSSSFSHSQSPFRYLHFEQIPSLNDTKRPSSPQRPLYSAPSSPFSSRPPPLLIPSVDRISRAYPRPCSSRISNLLKPWLPVILYAITSLGFFVAIAFYKSEVFTGLDELSRWLQEDPLYGQAVLFFLIFLTTFPPIPLYSTLIILSGYTFGPWTGAVISYFAALSGALTVFLISRTVLRDSISRWLSSTCTMKRVVRAIEKRPKLLFLIRLAPYPYNVMNCLLAASPTLTLRTYSLCTALSLFKVIIHTSLGASIHSFKDYHVVHDADSMQETANEESGADTVARMWTISGITLCVAIFIYLSYVARKAVDEQLDDDEAAMGSVAEETIAFLSPAGNADAEQGQLPMSESPLRLHQAMPLPSRMSLSVEPNRQGRNL